MANGHGGRRVGAGRKRTKETAIFREFKQARLDLSEAAKEHAPEALKKIASLVKCEDPRVALAASETILDRAYGRASQHVTVERPEQEMSDGELAAAISELSAVLVATGTSEEDTRQTHSGSGTA